MPDCMMPFPEDWHDFLKDYSFDDSQEVYTNGSRLIPVFRVEQLIEHLLKAQEPRVMTLEEVTEDRPDVVWFDDRHYKLTYPAFVSNGEVAGWVVSLSKGCYERHDHIDGYGKEWRCWTSRPTDEQREATPWESVK